MNKEDFLKFSDILVDEEAKDYLVRFYKKFVIYTRFEKPALGLEKRDKEDNWPVICYINSEINFKPFVKINNIIYKIVIDKYRAKPVYFLEAL
jgi:hypothetical protein